MSNAYIPGWMVGIGEEPSEDKLTPEEEREILDSLRDDEPTESATILDATWRDNNSREQDAGNYDPAEHARYLGEHPYADTEREYLAP